MNIHEGKGFQFTQKTIIYFMTFKVPFCKFSDKHNWLTYDAILKLEVSYLTLSKLRNNLRFIDFKVTMTYIDHIPSIKILCNN